jgi:hypothetical protein
MNFRGNSTDSGSGALLNTNVSQGPLASNNVAPIQINWVGRVGELLVYFLIKY